ncbi:MAG: DNA repair protein RecN [Chitinophagaceae bacterium]|nr:DNA repair protein RecN [Chitinophagaceae bacterium]
MLTKLSISNYAIISEIEINFHGNLNIITGETGAGKSILMGALSLILGDRADTSVLLNRERKCVVEGVFLNSQREEVSTFLRDHDLDAGDELVIRREIAVNGKSRTFINDTPVTLDQVKRLSSSFVDLHRQFDTHELSESDFQRNVLDALAGHSQLITGHRTIYRQWQQLKQQLDELAAQKNQFTKEYDYNKFLFDELEEADLKENELEEADAELKLLSNSEGIKSALAKIVGELSEGETPLVNQLKSLVNQLKSAAAYHPDLPVLSERLESAYIEVSDIESELGRVADHISHDPRRIEQLNDRLSVGYKLLKKHSFQTTSELILLRNMLDDKLQAVLNIDESIDLKQRQVDVLLQQLKESSQKITAGRKKQIKSLQEKVNKLLHQVGMPNARLEVQLLPSTIAIHGADNIEFLFDANKSNRFEPIRKVASGGELSRLMLCIKSLVAKSLDLPTLIFDEIDSGISGEAARQVGIIMKDLASQRQVISITHQPQIAGKANAHFFVYKEIKGDSIHTGIRELSTEERITTIAQMLSGERPTAAAIENAREMVMN